MIGHTFFRLFLAIFDTNTFVIRRTSYLRQVNEVNHVNGGDNVRSMSVCRFVCVRAAAGHGS